MAISKGIFKMNGSFGTASCYTLPGSDQMIIRTKGGPSKRRMKVGPEFAVVRKHQVEWSACVLFSQGLRNAVGEVYRLADYNVSPKWNGLGKNIIKTDMQRPLGERSLMISAYRDELSGFNLNKNYAFNAVLGVAPQVCIDRDSRKATVLVPRINTANDILNVRKLPYFRLIVTLGIISDLHFVPDGQFKKYESEMKHANGLSMSKHTDWLSTRDIIDEQDMSVQLEKDFDSYICEQTTFILSMGIEFGYVGFGGKIDGVKRAGAGKILLVK